MASCASADRWPRNAHTCVLRAARSGTPEGDGRWRRNRDAINRARAPRRRARPLRAAARSGDGARSRLPRVALPCAGTEHSGIAQCEREHYGCSRGSLFARRCRELLGSAGSAGLRLDLDAIAGAAAVDEDARPSIAGLMSDYAGAYARLEIGEGCIAVGRNVQLDGCREVCGSKQQQHSERRQHRGLPFRVR